MTRLEERRRTKYRSQFAVYFLLLIITIGFLMTIGLKLIIGTSVFISNLTHKKTTEPQSILDENILLPPEINDLPSATNSAIIKISGQTTAEKSLTIFVNDEKQKELISDQNGFSTAITLSEGNNEIYVEIEDEKSQQKKKSAIYNIVYKSKKPELAIEAPKDQEKVSNEEIVVKGRAEKNTTITINGAPTVISTTNIFSQVLKLSEGENKISVSATDEAGNTEVKAITVFYIKDL